MMSGHGEKPIFFNRKEIKCGRSQHSETPHPLCPITSHFCLTPPSLKVNVICVSLLISAKKKIPHKNYLKLCHINPSWKPSFTVFFHFS